MTLLAPVIGVPQVTIGKADITTALPSLASLVFSASAITPADFVNNEVRNPLSAANYQVCLGLWGYDIVNGGWTIGATSGLSGIVPITAGQMIKVIVPNANWPSGYTGAKLAAVFLKQGAGDPQLCDLMYIDPSNNTEFVIQAKPFGVLPSRSIAFLQGASTDSTFGTRAPYANIDTAVGVTTQGVTLDRQVTTVTVSPDNSSDYQVVTSRSCNVTFQTLSNDLKTTILGTSGLWAKFLAADGTTVIQNAQQTLLTASAILKGNAYITLDMPDQSKKIFVGNLTVSQSAVSTAYTKTAVAPIQFNLQTASIDTLTNGLDTEVSVLRSA